MTTEPAGAQPDSRSPDSRTWALIVWGLYILGAVTGFLALVGVILAYVKRADLRGTPFESHMTSAIRTFWIALIGGIVGVVLMVVAIGFLVLLAVAVWVLFRAIRGFVYAMDGKPIANPAGWL